MLRSAAIIPKAPLAELMGASRITAGAIQGGAEDLRHAVSSKIARGLFGSGASGAGPEVEDVNQSRRLLSLAAVRDGMDCGAAAKVR